MTDMRRLFRSASGDLPPAPFTVDDITARGRRRRRRRTVLSGVAVAGVVAVVATAIPYAQGQREAPPKPVDVVAPPATVAPFTTTVRGFTVDQDFTVEASAEITPGYESARVVRPHATDIGAPGGIKQQSGVLTVYRPGVFDPSRYATGTPVTVGGRTARTQVFDQDIQIPDPRNLDKTVPHTMRLPSVAWLYAADAWATVTATNDGRYYGMTAAQVLAVAEKFAPNAGGPPAAAPYRIGSLPPGWQIASVGSDDVTVLATGTGAVSSVVLARDDLSFTRLTGRVDLSRGILVSVQKNGTEGPYRHPFTHPGCRERTGGEGAFCDRAIGSSGYYAEVADRSGTLTGVQVDTLTQSLDFADPARTGTWIPVTG